MSPSTYDFQVSRAKGTAERFDWPWTLVEMIRSMLVDSELPKSFFGLKLLRLQFIYEIEAQPIASLWKRKLHIKQVFMVKGQRSDTWKSFDARSAY